ncbi:hypothetical protein IQ255_17670 [Pleurocapsales cyanobacterium LEGE 10410]|nr:hypothetical protein [Pleurocapsales cyanobacterium LEGE 10410]
MSKTNRTCFFPEEGDSAYFASSVVVNNKYLAVGDTGTNKVIIYTPDNFGKWSRTREILPPVNSALDREGSIFGNNLELDGDTLVIGARTKNEVGHLPLREQTGRRYSSWRYLINVEVVFGILLMEIVPVC